MWQSLWEVKSFGGTAFEASPSYFFLSFFPGRKLAPDNRDGRPMMGRPSKLVGRVRSRVPVPFHLFLGGLRQQLKLFYQLLDNGRFVRRKLLQGKHHGADALLAARAVALLPGVPNQVVLVDFRHALLIEKGHHNVPHLLLTRCQERHQNVFLHTDPQRFLRCFHGIAVLRPLGVGYLAESDILVYDVTAPHVPQDLDLHLRAAGAVVHIGQPQNLRLLENEREHAVLHRILHLSRGLSI